MNDASARRNPADLLAFNFSTGDRGFRLDAHAELPGRGVTALFGPSGVGKTTLLRCIAGLLQVEGGYCRVGEQVWQDGSTFIPPHRREMGLVFQQANLFKHLTIEDNLRFGFNRVKVENRSVKFPEIVDLLELREFLQRRPHQLSGGQQQRVAIARALLTSPRLLLMDEPLASLDDASKRAILPYLEQLHEVLDIPVLYISHSLSEILSIADWLAYMEEGQILASGPLNELLTRQDLPLAYLDEACVVIEGRVTNHGADHLSEVSTAAGTFYLSKIRPDVGQNVRVRIAARDVSIALTSAADSSIQHILPARITAISPAPDPSRQLLQLKVGREVLLASVTARSVSRLQLQIGQSVFAQVKSVALT